MRIISPELGPPLLLPGIISPELGPILPCDEGVQDLDTGLRHRHERPTYRLVSRFHGKVPDRKRAPQSPTVFNAPIHAPEHAATRVWTWGYLKCDLVMLTVFYFAMTWHVMNGLYLKFVDAKPASKSRRVEIIVWWSNLARLALICRCLCGEDRDRRMQIDKISGSRGLWWGQSRAGQGWWMECCGAVMVVRRRMHLLACGSALSSLG